MPRLRLDLSYDGTCYHGWARQSSHPSVQQEIEDGLQTVLRLEDTPALTVAGRTDTGVHATGQVAHVDLEAPGDLDELVRRLNGLLPHDIRINALSVAPAAFDARFAALWRRYEYRIADHTQALNPLARLHTLAWSRPLDVDQLNAASEDLRGHHDFAAFCKKREGATTVRTLLRLDWRRDAEGVVIATFQADAFCHSMVRALVGALIPVGEGRRPLTWPREVLVSRARHSAVEVARPHGLTLVEVAYPSDAELIQRVEETRRKRDELLHNLSAPTAEPED